MAKSVLSADDELFISYYFANGFNATQAFIKLRNIDTSAEDYDAFKVRRRAYNFSNKVCVKEEIQRQIKAECESRNITKERIINEIAEVAFNGSDEKNKLKALELLAKQSGILTEKLKIETNTIEVNIVDDEK